jgi:hypothetical protein
MEHDCLHEKELGELTSSVNRFGKEIFGNGKEGLSATVPKLTVEVTNLKESIDDLRTAISGLNRFMDETKGSQNTFKNAVPWISVMVAVIALAFTIATTSNMKREKEYVRSQLNWKQDRPPDPTTRSLSKEAVDKLTDKKQVN